MAGASAQRVVVGMSGGVDSAVAALRLIEAGHEVHGLYMSNWDDEDVHCSNAQDYQDARAAARELGIVLHRVSFEPEYRERVFAEFLDEYRRGRTPNPDVLCNREIKFGVCLHYAQRLGARWFATGHYARLTQSADGPMLLRGADAGKDQSYFLCGVERARFAQVLFPIGELEKAEVRARAKRAGLPVFNKRDSTGICFIGERPFAEFLAAYLPEQPGPIESADGRQLGTHRGLHFYTLPARVMLQDFTGVPCVVDLAAMRDAIAKLGGDPEEGQPAAAGRSRDRSLGAGGRVRHRRGAFSSTTGLEFERNRERYAVPALGPEGVPNFRVVPPDTGIVPPGQPRVPRPRRVRHETATPRAAFVSRHARRHRLAHHDDQRPRRARLGRRRHRGRGGDARPAGLDADSAGRRLPLHGKLPGRDRDRPRAHRHRDAAQEGRGRKVRRVLRRAGSPTCRSPIARRSRTWRPSTARPAASSRSTRRRSLSALSGRPREQVALVEAYAKAQGLFAHGATPIRLHRHVLELDLGDVEPSLAGPKRPQDRVPLRIAKRPTRRIREKWPRSARRRIPPPPAHTVPVDGKCELRGQRWRGADRRDHQLHQHLESDVMIAAGLLARNARRARPHLASPGSRPASRRARAWSPTTCARRAAR
jgi:tRNA (5-methylaminomethyl-2-thiouridylate)-methyltransferase